MKKYLGTILLSVCMLVPASADITENLPLDREQIFSVVSEAAKDMDLPLPAELFTPGQREVFQNMEFDKEQGLEMALQLLRSQRGENKQAILPQLMGLVGDDEREKLTLSKDQTRFLFGVVNRLSR